MSDMSDTIRISKRVAIWIITFATQLVRDGLGVDFNPYSPSQLEPSNSGFIDEIPMSNGELWRFMNSVISFARSVACILARDVRDIDELSSLTLTDEE